MPEARSFRIILNSGGKTNRALSIACKSQSHLSVMCVAILCVIGTERTWMGQGSVTHPHGCEHHQEENETVGVGSTIHCICLAGLEPEQTCKQPKISTPPSRYTVMPLNVVEHTIMYTCIHALSQCSPTCIGIPVVHQYHSEQQLLKSYILPACVSVGLSPASTATATLLTRSWVLSASNRRTLRARRKSVKYCMGQGAPLASLEIMALAFGCGRRLTPGRVPGWSSSKLLLLLSSVPTSSFFWVCKGQRGGWVR